MKPKIYWETGRRLAVLPGQRVRSGNSGENAPRIRGAIYFDNDGAPIEDRIDGMEILGGAIQGTVLPRNKILSSGIMAERIMQRFAQLCDFALDDMEIRPFAMERRGMHSGFIPLEPEEEDEDWCVEFHPEIS